MPAAAGAVATATLADLAGPLHLRWLSGPCRWVARTVATFDVPGLDEALRTAGLPRAVVTLLETLSAGMVCVTEGERDAAGTVRRRHLLDATPDRPARRLLTVEAASGERIYSRDGSRFGPIADLRSPAETERALEGLGAVALAAAEVAETPAGRRVTATLEGAAIDGLVDTRRLLGAGGGRRSLAVEALVAADRHRLVLRLDATADTEVAAGVTVHSETVVESRDLDAVAPIAVPAVSLSMPSAAGVEAAMGLATPRGSRATKRRRR